MAGAQQTHARAPVPEQAARAQALTFAGALLSAVYVPDGGDRLRLVEPGGHGSARYGLPDSYVASGRSAAARAFRSGRPLWLDAAELAEQRELTPGSALPADVSLAVLPLGADGRSLGCMLVVGADADGFDAEQRGFLELYADQVAVGLQAYDEPGGPGPVASRPLFGAALSRLRVGSFTLVPSTGRIDVDPAVLDLVDIAPQDFDGLAETLLAHTVPEDLPALMSILDPAEVSLGGRSLEFRILPQAGAAPESREPRWLRLSCRVLPAKAEQPERVLGVLADASSLRPSADEVSRVQRLAASLAGAVTTHDVGRAVVAALRAPLGADRVALAEVEADRLVVTVLDPPEPSAWPEVWRTEWRSEWPDAPISALPTLGAAIREGRVTLHPAGADLEPGLAGIGPGGLAVLPLPAQGKIVGGCMIGWDEPHAFEAEERSLLTATAGLVGQALMRAHAYDAEHELATMLQRSLLPRRLPALPGAEAVARYLPAMTGLEVGGDWYDVIPLSSGRVALVIGDVQGHSAAAATIMGQMRTAIRAYAVEGHPPDIVVSHANRLLVGMETDLFATCCYVELDLEEGDAWIVRAGHLPPVLRAPDGKAEEIAAEGGPPLGVLAETDFPITAAALAPGSVLALMTDGLVESASLPLEEGIQRLCEALSAARTADIGRMADELIGDHTRRDDDVALLLVRYDGMPSRPIRAGWAVWRLPDAVMHARRFTARTLRTWKIGDAADPVLLIVSELVTNALVHTRGEVRLDLTLAGDRLRVAVTDASPRAPAKPVIADWEATGGRGILLVEAMSAAWGTVPVSGGKQVWSELVVEPRVPAEG